MKISMMQRANRVDIHNIPTGSIAEKPHTFKREPQTPHDCFKIVKWDSNHSLPATPDSTNPTNDATKPDY